MNNAIEKSPRSLPKIDRKHLRAKLPEAVILMATSKAETVVRFAEMLAMAETVPGLAHLTINQIINDIVRLDPEYLRGGVEPESDSPVAPVLFKILEMLHFANMYYQKNDDLSDALEEDDLVAARMTVYKNIEEVTAEFVKRNLAKKAQKMMGKKRARRNVGKLFQNLQNLKEKMIYASDVIFLFDGVPQHKLIRGEKHSPTDQEKEEYVQNLVRKYSNPAHNESPQKAEWLVSFGLAKNGKIGISKPLSVQVDFRQIPEWLVRSSVDYKANTGIPLLELASEFGLGFTLGVQGEEDRQEIPYEVAHRLVISKLPVDLDMLAELLEPKEQDREIIEHDDLVFDVFSLVTLRGIGQMGNLVENEAA